ncbi:MAG: alpha-xylosidase [Chitinivibrionales bacterium]|nr:alpha-xylosidase [Chitinivibrionales bacterium]MBD3395920.1 alpha-xylosidase [Chitinivibrionales bacterium]
MKQKDNFFHDFLDFDSPESTNDRLWIAQTPSAVTADSSGAAVIEVPFCPVRVVFDGRQGRHVPDDTTSVVTRQLAVRAEGDSIVRVSMRGPSAVSDSDNPMLQKHESLTEEPLQVTDTGHGWRIADSHNRTRMEIETVNPPQRPWTEPYRDKPLPAFCATVYPDGAHAVPLKCRDCFGPLQSESLALGYVERDNSINRICYSIDARPDEKFAGTGERFSRMDLAGGTYVLENTDGFGVNSRRAYKNVPFYVSSKGYGLLILSSAHIRLSLADISTRAAQGLIEDNNLDLFFIGGDTVERIVYDYRRLTGFPPKLPLWSYGSWMSRMTYFSEKETRDIVSRLREEKFPCDVIHLDTGWFRKDWVCEWEFGEERFPDPARYIRDMKEQGIRITLWQTPWMVEGCKWLQEARDKNYVAPTMEGGIGGALSDESGNVDVIDFTNPDAEQWYLDKIENLLRLGAVAIKTDFGENINMQGGYHSLPPRLLHNLFALLYQKAVFNRTREVTGQGIIWARSGWTGAQRYPVHWGGDSACTWDGLAGSIRGGLHLGLSGFAFWSHDVPGFHSIPEFMNTRVDPLLYLRWTQAAVFGSHIRYHGTSPREPYEFPEVADIVRMWLDLRYALIPYLVDQSEKAARTGFPIMRALVFDFGDDPACWHIDDQWMFGDTLLVAPVFTPDSRRNVYLPEGAWVDFWTGRAIEGPQWLKNTEVPLERIPVFARHGKKIRVYPDIVQCTDEMDLAKSVEICFDDSYAGAGSAKIASLA